MPRPLYETAKDLHHEQEIINILSDIWECRFQKLPIAYSMDYSAERDGCIVAFVEIKRRNVKGSQYPSIMVSMNKHLKAKQYDSLTGIKTFFVIAYNDSLKYIDLTETPNKITTGGRTDRNDHQDVEPVIHYNIDRLTTIRKIL